MSVCLKNIALKPIAVNWTVRIEFTVEYGESVDEIFIMC